MKKKVIAFFKKNPGRGFKPKEISQRLQLDASHEYSELKSVLHKLYEDQFITKSGKKYKLNMIPSMHKITGVLEITEGGFGFVVVDNRKIGDIFIAARNLGTAFNGDKVEVALFASRKGKNIEGQVINVLKRKRDEIIGILEHSHNFYFIKPDDPNIPRDIYVEGGNLKGANIGDKVIVGNIQWESSMLNPEGEIIEVLGKAGSKDAEITSIAKEFNLPYTFPPKVIDESEKIEKSISNEETENRIDFRKDNVFTIDPIDAKDFDDALSIKKLGNGNFSVGIHIADVGHYVKSKSDIDKEALKRGNSVYLIGKVIPMLPERISNFICSLVPDEDRLTYSVIAELTKRGKLVQYEIKKSVIRSKRRFNYDEVQEIIESGNGDFYDDIAELNSLAQTLRKKRMREGSIEFFTPEIKFELDEDSKPVAIFKKELKQSNMLVEEFMLLANKICAKHISLSQKNKQKPFIYRVHDLPDQEKIFEFAKFVKSLGYSFAPDGLSKSNQFQLLIKQVRGKKEEDLINELAIRSMAKAVYSADNIGHFGLGFKYYTHFTSPIRRYSDLMVHRLLYQYIDGVNGTNYSYNILKEISDHISQTERSAIEAERFSIKLKQIEYLKDHIGEEFDAIISGIIHFGMFVKILENLAEGLVKIRDLEGDFYVYDEKKYSLIGRNSKKQFRLGDKVRVKLVRVDQEKSELDFIIIDH
ncbi:MAG: ribonuclease R [Ignavibacteriaceae bacterium]